MRRSYPITPFQRGLALAQGLYDLVGGLWPLLHFRSFEEVTGPKVDHWLVRTVAGMLVVMGVVLLRDAYRNRVPDSMRTMAGGLSGVLAIVALISSVGGWISWTYFLDGLIHLSFALGWIISGAVLRQQRKALL